VPALQLEICNSREWLNAEFEGILLVHFMAELRQKLRYACRSKLLICVHGLPEYLAPTLQFN
jgi:hypothetical protein